MDDVRGDFIRPPHGTTPAAVIANAIVFFTHWSKFKCIFGACKLDFRRLYFNHL